MTDSSKYLVCPWMNFEASQTYLMFKEDVCFKRKKEKKQFNKETIKFLEKYVGPQIVGSGSE